MAPIYQKALILGATSGIGEALAAKLIAEGTNVIAVGRRQDRLDHLVATHGPERATAVRFDVARLPDIPSFAASIIEAHPDLDCVVVNAGIQRAFDFTKPGTVDLASLDMELTTNYTAPVHITTAFLSHLMAAKGQSHLVFVSASLALIPALIRTPNYNASKAALHAFVMNLRQQLKEAGRTNVRVVEVFPPAVQTELHDTKHQPDMVNGGELGMPLGPYIEKMYEGLVRGDEQFAIGPREDLLRDGGWEAERARMFQEQNIALKASISKFLKT
ncbi:putative oxidoreductase-like protein [Hapsidospora chrysogenum ATCC 11550]|uniref:Putative oxidoreductase-like protein n=1 Tax=Hapsidospora chrysogenum (strain ATCC 11550 / CBS 779.69 / DSM 880 / IAM 14645 / JCM 23072 / IMI 49137) TaxID=857340 RepID=A0A086SWW0_HAPC1|nr:putative oxidoreductase-like protein [Hapsidospora chrysogenum ATCC 11550]